MMVARDTLPPAPDLPGEARRIAPDRSGLLRL